MEVGGIKLEYLGHSGFLITNGGGNRIAIDPYNVSQGIEKVDLILITHGHYDHCSIKDIELLAKKGTIVVVPPDAQSKVTRVKDVEMQVMNIKDEFSFGHVKIETVHAYNVEKEFHPKKEGWVGYLLKFPNVVIYHAGDTDKISEMNNLTGYAGKGTELIALLPVSGQFVMTAEEAADAAEMIKPSLAVPMHYGSGVVGSEEDAKKFVEICRKSGINAMILNRI
ncbi:MAG: MBL fold metallo-hydrolase [archaeon]|nr:MBL fold metallo-hydrolase [archaeon]